MLKKRYLWVIFLVIFGLALAVQQPDPDSGATISCNSPFDCPGAKMVHGFPFGITPYDGSTISQPHFSINALLVDAVVCLIIAYGLCKIVALVPKHKKRDKRDNPRH